MRPFAGRVFVGLALLLVVLILRLPDGLAGALSPIQPAGLSRLGASSSVAELGATLSGRATRITDGDTIRIGDTRIRLRGIDAPEMSTPNGEPARRHLANLIGPQPVRCTDTGERSYDRVVAVCYGADGRDLGEAMVEAGWAVDLPRFSGGRYTPHQAEAARLGVGIYANGG
jgi:endonuclease YncB( thermonuclease family)